MARTLSRRTFALTDTKQNNDKAGNLLKAKNNCPIKWSYIIKNVQCNKKNTSLNSRNNISKICPE